MIHYSNCPLCLSEKIEIYLRPADHFLSKELFKLWRCQECGFVFTQDSPDEGNIGNYYESDDYISHNDSVKGVSSTLYRMARSLMIKRKRRMVLEAAGLKTGSLLDIGSGTGHFLSVMKKGGWNVKGIEINKKARDFSASEFGLDVLPGDMEASLPSSFFDVITLWHVLEHFHDPFSNAAEILRMLKPGGVCLAALPNCSSFDSEHYREFWAAYDVPRHLWHFTPDAFRAFAEKTGFLITEIKPLPFDVFYISVLSEKYKNTRFYFLTGMIKGFWFALQSLFKKNKSSSIIYFLSRK